MTWSFPLFYCLRNYKNMECWIRCDEDLSDEETLEERSSSRL